MSTVKIVVREVGEKFAHEAKVVASNGRTLHTTRKVPYGFMASSVKAAEAWVADNGHILQDDDDDAQ